MPIPAEQYADDFEDCGAEYEEATGYRMPGTCTCPECLYEDADNAE